MALIKITNRNATIHNIQHRQLTTAQHEHKQNHGDELRLFERISRFCSMCVTRRISHASSNPVISEIW